MCWLLVLISILTYIIVSRRSDTVLAQSHPLPSYTVGYVHYLIILTRAVATRIRSLKDSKGILADCQESVAGGLNTFESTLERIDHNIALQPQQIQIVGARIDVVIRRYLQDVENFCDYIHNYKNGLCQHRPRSLWHKVLWLIQITNFKRKLAAYQDGLNMQLEVLSVPSSLFRKQEC